jgi:hypothetical protein
MVYTLKATANAVTSFTLSWNSQIIKMMAEVSDVTWKNREETREACTMMETLLLLVITGDNNRDIQTFVVFCK